MNNWRQYIFNRCFFGGRLILVCLCIAFCTAFIWPIQTARAEERPIVDKSPMRPIILYMAAANQTDCFSKGLVNAPIFFTQTALAFVRNTIDKNVQPEESLISKQAQTLLDKMTLEEKVGQLFIARCPQENAAQKVTDYHLGGYILFANDFKDKTKEMVVQTIQSYQDAADIPLFIGVDEEGGKVNRISLNANLRTQPFSSAQTLYAAGGFERIASDTLEKCQLLHSLGINVNFAPVCDVSQNPTDFIYARTFGQDAKQTAEYVKNVLGVMQKEAMGSVLKHFPGYGNNADTHTGIAYDERSYETLQAADLLPFQAGIEQGADMVLVSHNVVKCLDAQNPASLSPKVHQILREELGFTGLIITDELSMKGIQDFVSADQAAVMAILAGNDLLCCTDFEIQIPAVLAAVQSGEISEKRIDESVKRVLMCKLSLGIL